MRQALHLMYLRCIHVDLLYLQDQAKDRPTMLDVVSMLQMKLLNHLLQNNLHFLPTKLQKSQRFQKLSQKTIP